MIPECEEENDEKEKINFYYLNMRCLKMSIEGVTKTNKMKTVFNAVKKTFTNSKVVIPLGILIQTSLPFLGLGSSKMPLLIPNILKYLTLSSVEFGIGYLGFKGAQKLLRKLKGSNEKPQEVIQPIVTQPSQVEQPVITQPSQVEEKKHIEDKKTASLIKDEQKNTPTILFARKVKKEKVIKHNARQFKPIKVKHIKVKITK